MGRSYDSDLVPYIRSLVKPNALCFDVGANVGVYVLQLAYWSSPAGRVVAFEPNPLAVAALERHIEMNHARDRVSVVRAAVGEKQGSATLFAQGSDGMSRLAAPNALLKRTSSIPVPVITLDSYCESTGLTPDLLLIDIEGFEMAAIAGARNLIRRHRDLILLVEMHPDIWRSAGMSRERAAAILSDLGLRAAPLSGQSDPLSDYGLVRLLQD